MLPGLHPTLACYVRLDFDNTNHDGPANIGLFIVTLRVALVALALRSLIDRSDVLTPQGYDYLTDHALFYGPAASLCAALCWWLGRSIGGCNRQLQPADPPDASAVKRRANEPLQSR